MKQRIKMATALVHDPTVLLLDEPFNGMDPRQRLHLMDLLHQLGDEGRTVLFSSHILEEVEQIAGRIEVMVAGRHAASGDFREIRRLMTQRPHQYTIRSSDDRALASAVIADGSRRPASSWSADDADGASGPRPGRRLRGVRPRAAPARLPATASGCSRSGPPTSRSSPSSPTWWRDERPLMNRTVAQLTARSLLGRRRTLLLMLLPLALLGLCTLRADPRRPRPRHRRGARRAAGARPARRLRDRDR